MRFIYLQHIPYRHLPEDFAARFPESVITTPYFDVAEPTARARRHSRGTR